MKYLLPLLLVFFTFLGCITHLPKGKVSMGYNEVITFMQNETNSKSPSAYSRLSYLRSEKDYHVLEGSVSSRAMKFTPFGIDRYVFRVTDADNLPNFNKLNRVSGGDSAFIRDFWGPAWNKSKLRPNKQ